MSSPGEIFLSHASADAARAVEIAEVLRGHGIPAWYAPHQILGARQWQDEIGFALRRCDWFVLLLSPAAVESMWVRRELQYALEQKRYDGRITPVVLAPCEFDRLSWVLSLSQMVDMAQDTADNWKSLLRVWGVGYKGRQ